MKVLIVDDDQRIVEKIKEKVEECDIGFVKKDIRCITDANQLEADISTNIYDIIYLDIEMGSANGIQVAKELYKKNPSSIIIFVTSHLQYITDAFGLRVFQYLYKPNMDEKFEAIFRSAVRRYKKYNSLFLLNTSEGKVEINPMDILYVETYYETLKIVTRYKHHYSNIKNLKGLKEVLEEYDFIQVHQSYYVNLRHIYKIDTKTIVLNNEEHIQYSIKRKKEIVEAFHRFIVREDYDDESDI